MDDTITPNYFTENVEKPDLIARLFNEKFEKQKLSLGEITTLISERQKILGRNLKTLDYQICEIDGIKHTFNEIHYAPDLASFLKDKISMEKATNDLTLKKAEEYKQYWKDINPLRKELLEGLMEFMSVRKKAEILMPGYTDSKPSFRYPQKPSINSIPNLGVYT